MRLFAFNVPAVEYSTFFFVFIPCTRQLIYFSYFFCECFFFQNFILFYYIWILAKFAKRSSSALFACKFFFFDFVLLFASYIYSFFAFSVNVNSHLKANYTCWYQCFGCSFAISASWIVEFFLFSYFFQCEQEAKKSRKNEIMFSFWFELNNKLNLFRQMNVCSVSSFFRCHCSLCTVDTKDELVKLYNYLARCLWP